MSSMWAYAGEFLTEQWRVAVNFALIAATQNAIAIMMQNIMQRRRRSQKPEIAYWTLKVLIQDLFLAIIMGGYMESHIGLYIFYIILKVITSVTNFLILYYTLRRRCCKDSAVRHGCGTCIGVDRRHFFVCDI